MIKILNNFFTKEQAKGFYSHYINKEFRYGEADNFGQPPTGLVHDIYHNDECIKTIEPKIFKEVIETGYVLQRAYLNLFLPNEKPYYHTDPNNITVMLYLTEGDDGETLFQQEDNTLLGVLPALGRIVIFDGSIKHKATTHRNKARLNLVLKYDYIS